MPAKRRIQLDDIQGIGAGKTAIINCPIGPRYHDITLEFGNTAAGNGNAPTVASCIGNVRCMIAGKVQREHTGTQLDVINTAMGSTFASQGSVSGGANGTGRTTLPIFFEEPWRKRLQDQDAMAWQTGFLNRATQTFQILVDIVSGITPALAAYATVDDFRGDGKPHGIMKWYKNDFGVNATPQTFTALEQRDLYAQISCFDTSDSKAVTNAKLTMGGLEIYNLTSGQNTSKLKNADMNPAAGAYHLVFDQDDSLDDVVPPTAQLVLKLDFASAPTGTISMISQRLGLPDGFGG